MEHQTQFAYDICVNIRSIKVEQGYFAIQIWIVNYMHAKDISALLEKIVPEERESWTIGKYLQAHRD